MRKFINGQYVTIASNATQKVAKKAESQAFSGDDAGQGIGVAGEGIGKDISKAALQLMQEQPAGMDWSQLTGTGSGGKVTVSDVRDFLQSQ